MSFYQSTTFANHNLHSSFSFVYILHDIFSTFMHLQLQRILSDPPISLLHDYYNNFLRPCIYNSHIGSSIIVLSVEFCADFYIDKIR